MIHQPGFVKRVDRYRRLQERGLGVKDLHPCQPLSTQPGWIHWCLSSPSPYLHSARSRGLQTWFHLLLGGVLYTVTDVLQHQKSSSWQRRGDFVVGSLSAWQWTISSQATLRVHHHVFVLTQWDPNHWHKVVKGSFWYSLEYYVSVRNVITFVKWKRIFQTPSSLAHFCCYGDQPNVRRSWFHGKAAEWTDTGTSLSPQVDTAEVWPQVAGHLWCLPPTHFVHWQWHFSVETKSLT